MLLNRLLLETDKIQLSQKKYRKIKVLSNLKHQFLPIQKIQNH
jgi:hypothetical protein